MMRRRQITCVFTEAAVRVESISVPVTSILAPVMYRESSEARKAQTSATSGGRQRDDKKKVWGSVGNWACQIHTAQSTSFSLDLLKRIKADGRVTCPCVWRAPGGSFLSLHKGVKRASSLTCWLTHPSKRHQRRHLKNMTDETMEDDSVSLESSGGSELSVKLLSVCRSC